MTTNEAAIATRSAALATSADMPEQVLALFQQALSQGTAGADALEKLVDLQERIHRRRAELEFSLALADFQSECPPINKASSAKITTKGGSSYAFTYADLETIVATVRPHLTAHGFSFTFDSTATGALLTCTCTLRHAQGHHMTSSFTLPTENASGASAQQKFGGALTYAKRQCLIAVLGLSLTDAEEPKGNVAAITDEQKASLLALMDEVKVAPAAFCERFKLETVADLPGTLYAEAVRLLEKRRKGVAK